MLRAAQHLQAEEEEQTTRERHLEHFLGLAERAAPELRGPAQVSWLSAFDHDWPNLRAALRSAESRDNLQALARIGIVLVPFWEVRGYLSEGRRWLDLALGRRRSPDASADGEVAFPDRADYLSPSQRARALIGAARLAQWQADLDRADALLEEGVVLTRDFNDQRLTAEALTWLGTVRRRRGEYDEAERLLRESVSMHEAHGDAGGAAWALCNLGSVIRNLAEQIAN